MKNKELMDRLFQANLTMNAAVWMGAADCDSPPDLLKDWFDDGELDHLGAEDVDEFYDFWCKHEQAMPFFAEFQFAVPRYFKFDEQGRWASCSTGGVYRCRIFAGESIENCAAQACTWAESEFAEIVAAETKKHKVR